MRLGSFKYLVKQGWKGMAANRLMTFASIGVLTTCLILTGIATLVSMNINRVVDYLGNQNEITVFLLDDVTPEQIDALQVEIDNMKNVAESRFVSREDAFAEMQQMMEKYAPLLAGYDLIFPANFRVTVEDLNFIKETTEQLSVLPGVDYADARLDVADAMLTVRTGAMVGGWALVIVLGAVSVIIISNTIRLTVFARRREISIMKYVGATNAFIRLPFFVEGITVGIVAGLVATGAVCGMYYLIMEYITGSYNIWLMKFIDSLYTLNQVWYWILGGFLSFGIIIGGLGTATSVRKHLKV